MPSRLADPRKKGDTSSIDLNKSLVKNTSSQGISKRNSPRKSTPKFVTSREQCTCAKRGGRRLGFQPLAKHEALQQARQTQSTPTFWKKYAKRSGIEGTIFQAVRVCEVRRSRYIGLAKTRLQMLATAAAINLHRVYDWLTEVPRLLTRTTLFASLAPEPSLVLSGWHA